jgi:hypothetical protein
MMVPFIGVSWKQREPTAEAAGIDHVVCSSVTGTQEHIRLRSP